MSFAGGFVEAFAEVDGAGGVIKPTELSDEESENPLFAQVLSWREKGEEFEGLGSVCQTVGTVLVGEGLIDFFEEFVFG